MRALFALLLTELRNLREQSPRKNIHHQIAFMKTPVTVREVGLRDGLQSIATILPTAQKLEWITAAYAAGQREIEVGSFVPVRLLPQLADTAELVAHAKTLPGLKASVLVPNLKGAERAIEVDAHALFVRICVL